MHFSSCLMHDVFSSQFYVPFCTHHDFTGINNLISTVNNILNSSECKNSIDQTKNQLVGYFVPFAYHCN